jgi:hypothetical protein
MQRGDPMSEGKDGVVVLGMGRSGTSAVTRMFVSARFFAGRDEDLMGATDANPTGHWENLNVWRVNEMILDRLHGTWLDPPGEDQQRAAWAWATPALLSVFECIVAEADNVPVVIKDPRIGVMLPVWGGIIEDRLHPVLVIRDPVEIAFSLLHRDGSPISFTLAAWQVHMVSVLRHFRRKVVTVAPYAELLGSAGAARELVNSAATHLRDELAGSVEATSAIVPDPALHHNRASPGDHEHALTLRQLELWTELANLAPGDQEVSVSDELLEIPPVVRGSVRGETERSAIWERAQHAQENASAAQERNAGLTLELGNERERRARSDDELARARDRIADLSSELEVQQRRAQAAESAHLRAAGWLDALQRSTSWRITAPLRAWKRTLRRLKPRSSTRSD